MYEILCARRYFATGRFLNQSKKVLKTDFTFSKMYFDDEIT